MIRRLLCKLGFHRTDLHANVIGHGLAYVCRDCGVTTARSN